MVAAMGASTTSGSSAYSATGQSGASSGSRIGLESQLNTFKKQLSDCINCDSAKTKEGKAKIEELQAKVSIMQERIKELDHNQNRAKLSTSNGLGNANLATNRPITDGASTRVSDVRNVQPTSRSSAAGAGPGSLVDTFA